MIYFISGHRDVTLEEFNEHYFPVILKAIETDPEAKFVMGDYEGVDSIAQTTLMTLFLMKGLDLKRITVYHMFEKPRNIVCEDFATKGGFTSDEERDAAMTKDSDLDIAFVRRGKRRSGTAQNIVRRWEF